MARGTRIDFTYPITALVGANGTNKTAILRALQGCPDYENLGNHWFSTELDVIRPNTRYRFIHGYLAQSQGKVVEAIKSRIERGTNTRPRQSSAGPRRLTRANPDYFEPSRPILSDGMEKMPDPVEGVQVPERVGTRWKAIAKDVVYLDFRSQLSAFDKYWFHLPYTARTPNLSAKKQTLRRRSARVAEAIQSRSAVYVFAKVNRIVESVVDLDSDHVAAISTILGREYSAVRAIRHTFFNVDGYTVLLRSGNLAYSEAFAGSGEFAVVMLVKAVLSAPEASLVLLDEPETSLHPGAQRLLMEFLVNQVRRRKLQIVFTTHSPEMLTRLPPDAIKVLQPRASDGRIEVISQASHASEAFFRLGSSLGSRTTIFVEDVLAQAVVRKALRPLGEPFNATLDIEVLPGGAGSIRQRFVPSFAQSDRRRTLVLLDGDQRPLTEATPSVDVRDAEVREKLENLLGGRPQVATDGHNGVSDESSAAAQYRKVYQWVLEYVDYLPGTTPEALIVDLAERTTSGLDSKQYWLNETRQALGRRDWEKILGREILQRQEEILAKVEDEHPALIDIRSRVQQFVTKMNGQGTL